MSVKNLELINLFEYNEKYGSLKVVLKSETYYTKLVNNKSCKQKKMFKKLKFYRIMNVIHLR